MIIRIINIIFISLTFSLHAQITKPIIINIWVTSPPENYENYPLIYVDFWATWCAPCISAMPHTRNLETKFGDRVLFVYLSDEPEGRIKKFMEKYNKHFLAASDIEGNTLQSYHIRSIPQAVILGPGGELLWEGNPLKLNEDILGQLVSDYGRKKGKDNRIILKKLQENELKTKIFKHNGQTLRFIKENNTANEYISEPGNFYLSGRLDYIVSVIKNVPPALVESHTADLPYYTFSSQTTDKDNFFRLIDSFLDSHTNVSVTEKQSEKDVYVVTEMENTNFFSPEMYDFEKGNNVPLLDETGIMLDNATIEQLLAWLSQQTGEIFVYEGSNTEIYDWNIQFSNIHDLIEQLTQELGLQVTSKKIPVTSYILSGKNP